MPVLDSNPHDITKRTEAAPYQIGNTIYMHPNLVAKLKQVTNAR